MRLWPAARDSRRMLLLALLAAVALLWLDNGGVSSGLAVLAETPASVPAVPAPAAAVGSAGVSAPGTPEMPPAPPPSSPANEAGEVGAGEVADTRSQAAPVAAPSGVTDIFSVRTWAPPPPPVEAKPAVPPKPEAPPLPFRFLGKIVDPEQSVAFLLVRGNQVLSVSVGEVIDGKYLVEKHQGGRLFFIYKPMNIRQSISVGRES